MCLTIDQPTMENETAYPAISRRIRAATVHNQPFPHWMLSDVLPNSLLSTLCQQRERNRAYSCNGLRDGTSGVRFITPHDICKNAPRRALVDHFSSESTICALETLTGVSLEGSRLRVSECSDQNGFWLAPHTDLPVKLLTMVIFSSETFDSQNLGTDLYHLDRSHSHRVHATRNSALLFAPGYNTIHGFERSIILGERQTYVVNFVTDEWANNSQLTGIQIHRQDRILAP